VTQSDLLTSSTPPLQLRGSPYSSRFAAPHTKRSELEASVNNALLGVLFDDRWLILAIELECLGAANCGVITADNELGAFFERES